MSQQCKTLRHKLTSLRPRWVEFTGTKGVLRCLNAQDDRTRAQGVIFNCPRCAGHKQKAHYCIFLFENAPAEARPHGRFAHNWENQLPADFENLSLWMLGDSIKTYWLRPGDVPCKWDGQLHSGEVSWRPNFLERVFKN